MKQPKRIRLAPAVTPNLHNIDNVLTAMQNIERAAGEVANALKRAADSLRESIGRTSVLIKPPR